MWTESFAAAAAGKAGWADMGKMLRVLGKRGRVTIPYEIRQRVGFSCNDILSFTEDPDGRTVVVRRERICEGCAEGHVAEDFNDTVTLEEFLDGLSASQQRAALIHLSVKWAKRQGGDRNAEA